MEDVRLFIPCDARNVSFVIHRLPHRSIFHLFCNFHFANVKTQSSQIEELISEESTFARVCSGFAKLALLIASIGLYGTMAYTGPADERNRHPHGAGSIARANHMDGAARGVSNCNPRRGGRLGDSVGNRAIHRVVPLRHAATRSTSARQCSDVAADGCWIGRLFPGVARRANRPAGCPTA